LSVITLMLGKKEFAIALLSLQLMYKLAAFGAGDVTLRSPVTRTNLLVAPLLLFSLYHAMCPRAGQSRYKEVAR
jgi:hypothetical protein